MLKPGLWLSGHARPPTKEEVEASILAHPDDGDLLLLVRVSEALSEGVGTVSFVKTITYYGLTPECTV